MTKYEYELLSPLQTEAINDAGSRGFKIHTVTDKLVVMERATAMSPVEAEVANRREEVAKRRQKLIDQGS